MLNYQRVLILVGGFNHLEKYESQWEGLSHILWKIKKMSKPPTSITIFRWGFITRGLHPVIQGLEKKYKLRRDHPLSKTQKETRGNRKCGKNHHIIRYIITIIYVFSSVVKICKNHHIIRYIITIMNMSLIFFDIPS
jgi:hypothetical protein